MSHEIIAVGDGVLVGRGLGVRVGSGFEGGGSQGGMPATPQEGGGSHGGIPATPQLGGGTGVQAAPVAGSIQSLWAKATCCDEKKAASNGQRKDCQQKFPFRKRYNSKFHVSTFLK